MFPLSIVILNDNGYIRIFNKKNVDIKLSPHGAFLEYPGVPSRNICVRNDYAYVPVVVIISRSFPHV
jgi:hypothetical protein